MITKITTIALAFIGLGLIANSFADDTELYVLESSARSNDNPQVLLILDTSGSMGDNSFTAPRFHDQTTIGNSTKLYFSNDGAVVPEASSNQYFLSSLNGCASSKAFLNEYGLYTGYFREYQESTWSKFPLTDGSSISTVDCYEDIYEQDTSNAGGVSGYPVDGLASPYDSDIEKAKLTEFGLGDPIHIYTQEYVTWFHNASKPNGKSNGDSYTRMDVAKRILEELIVSTPGIDFGLAIFNKNNNTSRDGGRIISGMKEASIDNKNSIITSIKDSDSINGNYTPLCETLFEAYSYLYGKPVKFGHKTDGSTSNPSYDDNIESEDGTDYISPFEGKDCQSNASIIYVTDGIPNNDVSADTAIGQLPGVDLTLGVDVVWSGDTTTNLLAPLANWMYKNDVNPNAPLDQTVSTYTIGFSSGADAAETLLRKTAENAGGEYYKANSAEALKASLLQAVTAIQGTDSSFTSPSVVLDKTQTGDAAYFAMFLPDKGPRWSGNLKKFKVTADGNVVDKDGNDAFDSNGAIAEEACSFWTSTAECNSTSYKGYHVSDGGVAAVMRSAYSSSINSRNVLLNNGSSGDLISFTPSNAKLNGFLSTDAKLASYMGVDESDISDSFDWAKGINVDNEDNDDNSSTAPLYLRQDIMGDPLHSRPLVINYGNESSPDNRIIMGTNHGFLHMFKDEVSGETSSVSESWAFMPVELLKNIKGLRDNPQTGVHSIYGMDGSPVAYIERDSSDKVSKAWLYVGMRRGGTSYYALDITDPDAPSLKWISQTSDFSIQGESWSEPVITKVPDWPAGATTSADANPVLIIGAGYNPTTKDGSSVGSSDTTGVGVYIIDADKGTKVHSFGLAGSDTSMPGLSDSIPNKVAILDSNNDQLTDRIYATDTGANVWRLDLPGLSTDSSKPWSAFKFASLGGGTTTTDIRFFSEPVVAQTTFSNVAEHTHTEGGTTTTTMTYQSIPYDAVVIGSGHRPHPLDKQRADKFFTLQDRNIVTKSYSSAAGNTTPDALDITDLYNVTSESPASDTELITFGTKRGWYYNFSDEGEKSLSAATIVSGRVFFTSYVPETGASENACLVPGQGRLYGFDLHKGARTYSYSEDYFVMGEQVPDTPTLVVPHNGDSDSYMYLIGIGDAANDMIKNDVLGDDGCAEGDDKCIGGGLGVNRIYYHQNEN